MDAFRDLSRDIKAETAERVRKLLTKAEDPATTPEEAHAFTMKAQQLMTKYSIDLAMIADRDRMAVVVERGWTIASPYAGHKVSLVNAVARANDCRAIYTDLAGGRKRIDVVGYPGDIEWVETLSRSLEVQLASALAAAMQDKPAHVHGRTYSVGFIQGFVNEIAMRLRDARQQAVRATSEVQSSVALVLVGKQHRVDDEFKVRHPQTRTVHRSIRLESWSGYAPGQAAGRKAALARGAVGGGRRTLSA